MVVESEALGLLLKRYRLQAGLTQEELAERAGVSARSVSDTERGVQQRPHITTLRRLADALELVAEQRMVFLAVAHSTTSRAGETAAPGTREERGMRETAPPAIQQQTTVRTFLVADVRGYTRFTAEQGDAAAARLAGTFAAIAQEVTAAHGGTVIELRGDEALAVFASPRDALHAAVALQGRFAQQMAHDPSVPLKVGIGLDAGEAISVEGGYRGGALNLAAHLCSIAGGGEVFSSETVIGLARKTEGLAFLDRGEVTLKGLSAPVRVIQIAPDGELPESLPPLQPVLVTHPTNLPDDPTPFIGREREIAAISGLVRQPSVRMVTLTGPGGTGKTRLALQVASTVRDEFRDGVFLVSLASLSDPGLVPSVLAQTLGVTEQGGTSLVDALRDYLQDRHLLLVLDNFEHLLPAATTVAALLDACRGLHVLLTSRIPLHLVREQEYPVPPLSIPDPRRLPSLEALGRYESVALFVGRAQAVKPEFALTRDNAPAVAAICARLDGLPLAIELATTRIKLFPPHSLLQQLESSLKLLTGGARDLPARQQTLRGTIDWSYSLLSEAELTLFARLSVFAGGCSVEGAEAVCNPDGALDVLEGLAALVDQSLLRQEGEDEPRFLTLETIRQYATERLEDGGAADTLRQQHARFFLAFAERAAGEIEGPRQARWLEQLEAEHDNLRAALRWSLDRGQAEIALRLAIALGAFWMVHNHWSEGRRWLEEALEASSSLSPALRARGLQVTAALAVEQSDYRAARRWCEQSLTLAERLGDSSARAAALSTLADLAGREGNYREARALFEESVALYRELDDKEGTSDALLHFGSVARRAGDHLKSEALTRESLALARELGDTHLVAMCLGTLGDVARAQGELERAQTLLEEALTLQRQIKDRNCSAQTLSRLGAVALERGDPDEARRWLEESLALFEDVGASRNKTEALLGLGRLALMEGNTELAEQLCTDSLRVAWALSDKRVSASCLEVLAEVAQARGRAERAACLSSAGACLRETIGVALTPLELARRDQSLALAREQLGEAAFAAAWAEGASMSGEQAVAWALKADAGA